MPAAPPAPTFRVQRCAGFPSTVAVMAAYQHMIRRLIDVYVENYSP